MAKYRIDVFDRTNPEITISSYTNSYKNRIPRLKQNIMAAQRHLGKLSLIEIDAIKIEKPLDWAEFDRLYARFQLLIRTPMDRVGFRVYPNTFTIHEE